MAQKQTPTETILQIIAFILFCVMIVFIIFYVLNTHDKKVELLETICEDQDMYLTDWYGGQYVNPDYNRSYYEKRYKVECDGEVQHQTYRICNYKYCIEENKWGRCKDWDSQKVLC